MSILEQQEALTTVMARARVVLLDFDGPVCAVFAGYPAERIGRALAAELLPDVPQPPTDPLVVLRESAGRGPDLLADAEARLEAAELEAVDSAAPTDGSPRFLDAAARTKRPVVIVSNNSEAAIRRYLAIHDLGHRVSAVVARPRLRPGLMKPHPHLVTEALSRLRARPSEAVMIGDSATDVLASVAVGVPVVGYANKPGKVERLTEAGADAICTSMGSLADALA